jgi:ParB/RepB/Spo0J family partition protein
VIFKELFMPPFTPKPDVWLLDQIVEGLNSRKIEIDDGIRELCESILANGLLQPLLVLDNRHLIAGFRRLAALRLAKVETASVLVFPSTLTPSQIRVINLTENVQRLDLSDPELYLAASELLKLNPDWTRKALSEHLGKSQSTVTHWLSPSDLIPDAQQAFLEGKFGFTKAYAIAKLPPESQSGLLALTLSGSSRDDIEREGRRSRSKPSPEADPQSQSAKKVKIAVATDVATGQVSVAGSPGEEIDLEGTEALLREALKMVRSAKDKSLTVRSAVSVWADMAKAGA